MKLHPDVQALSEAMHDIEAFLRSHNESFWADHVEHCVAFIDRSDAYGLSKFLSLFGGMGSLNDLVLHRNGSPLPDETDHLRALTDRAWRLATDLTRESL